MPDSGTDEELKDAFVQAFHPVCCHCPSPRLLNRNQCVTCLLVETSSYESAQAQSNHLLPVLDWLRPFVAVAGFVAVASGEFNDTLVTTIGFGTALTVWMMTVTLRAKNAQNAEQQAAASTGRTGNFTGLLE